MLRRTNLDQQQQEVKFPEPVTEEQLEPALPPEERDRCFLDET